MEPGRTRSVGADYQKVWAAGSKLHHSCFMPVSWPFFKATCFTCQAPMIVGERRQMQGEVEDTHRVGQTAVAGSICLSL